MGVFNFFFHLLYLLAWIHIYTGHYPGYIYKKKLIGQKSIKHVFKQIEIINILVDVSICKYEKQGVLKFKQPLLFVVAL